MMINRVIKILTERNCHLYVTHKSLQKSTASEVNDLRFIFIHNKLNKYTTLNDQLFHYYTYNLRDKRWLNLSIFKPLPVNIHKE